jgi:hypothetical protein
MLFTGHLTIFHYNVFSRMIQRNLEDFEKTCQGTCGKTFNVWVVLFYEIQSVENRVFA